MIDRQQSSKALIGISMAVIFSTQVIGSIAALYLLRGTLSSGERRMYAAVVALSIASGLLKGYHDDCLASIFLKDHNTCKLFG